MSVMLAGPMSMFVSEVLPRSDMQLLLSAPRVKDSTIVARSVVQRIGMKYSVKVRNGY